MTTSPSTTAVASTEQAERTRFAAEAEHNTALEGPALSEVSGAVFAWVVHVDFPCCRVHDLTWGVRQGLPLV